jgi:hypothetical protein
MTDLINLTPKSDSIVVEIKHPVTDEPLVKDDGKAMTVTVYLPHSPQYKQVVHDRTNKYIQRSAKGKKNATMTAAEIEDMTLDLIVKTTKDWNIQLDGKSPKFSEAAAKELYNNLPWLKDQITDAQNDFEAYLGN